METAIVTGAAGFVGSHLAEKLLEKKFKVIGIDCFTDYYSMNLKRCNLEQCMKNRNFIFLKEDLISADLASIFKKSDILFHEAGQPGVRNSWGNKFEMYLKNNVLITQRILEIAKKVKTLKKIVLASSSSVYGDQPGSMNENIVPKPISPYGVTKLASENLGLAYAQNYDLPITSLRYFSVYGPRQRPDMAFSRFIHSNLKNEPIIIYGNGTQSRDFTFISDIVDSNIQASQSATHGNILNIGGGSVHKIKEVMKMIENITGIKNNIIFEQQQKGDVKRTESDITLATRVINYAPKISIRAGLTEQIEWTKSII